MRFKVESVDTTRSRTLESETRSTHVVMQSETHMLYLDGPDLRIQVGDEIAIGYPASVSQVIVDLYGDPFGG